MADVTNLLNRIDAEFSALDERVKRAQQEQLQEHQERQKRLAAFEKLLVEMKEVWKPRLAALLERFAGRVKVTPEITTTSREAVMEFQSNLARIKLRLSASTDREVRKLVLDYNLEIIPILMQFDSHQRGEWPLEAVDRQAVGAWVDDRLVDFVKTYLSLHENEWYLKDHMVVDPIADVRFPKYAAGDTLEWQGKTYYFISQETRREFEAKNGIAAK
jgi:YHS domain-containing protein